MKSFPDPKPMAKALRSALEARGVELTHSEALELVAKQLGFDDWNTLSARLDRIPNLTMPEGWGRAGGGEEHYAVGVNLADPASPAIIQSLADLPSGGFASMVQTVRAKEFREKRMRFSAEVRATEVDGGAAIWMRVDRPGASILDNLSDRPPEFGPLQGTTDWTRREIVIDVPLDADSFHFGPMLTGTGRCEARGMVMEEVGADVRVTSRIGRWWKDRSQNLDLSRRRSA